MTRGGFGAMMGARSPGGQDGRPASAWGPDSRCCFPSAAGPTLAAASRQQRVGRPQHLAARPLRGAPHRWPPAAGGTPTVVGGTLRTGRPPIPSASRGWDARRRRQPAATARFPRVESQPTLPAHRRQDAATAQVPARPPRRCFYPARPARRKGCGGCGVQREESLCWWEAA